MGTLNDSDLTFLLGEGADGFVVPVDGPALVLDALEEQAVVVPLHRRRRVQLTSAAAVVAVGAVLGVGLFGGSGVDRVGQLAGAPNPVAAQDFSPESGQGPLAAGESTGGQADLRSDTGSPASGDTSAFALQDRLTSASANQRTAASAPGAKAALPAPQAAAPPQAAPVADGARVVKKGAIALIVDDDQVTPTLTEVQGFAKAVGGLVAGAQTQESGPTPSGSVTLRVPVDAFEEVVAQVRGTGADVRSATTSGQDVTAQYADLEAQLRTLTAARERFLEILAGARSIGDVLAVQQRVDDVTGKIDRLEGQRRVLAAQSDSATLEVTVTERDDPVVREVEEPDTGLSKAFSDAGRGFTTGVEALVRLSGRGVLLLLLAVAAYAGLRTAWRVSRRRLV